MAEGLSLLAPVTLMAACVGAMRGMEEEKGRISPNWWRGYMLERIYIAHQILEIPLT